MSLLKHVSRRMILQCTDLDFFALGYAVALVCAWHVAYLCVPSFFVERNGGVPDTASRKVLSLAGSLLAQEDPHPRLFDLLHEGCAVANVVEAEDSGAYEALFALKALYELGYVARPRSSVVDEFLMADERLSLLVVRARNRHANLVEAVNNTLAHTGLPRR